MRTSKKFAVGQSYVNSRNSIKTYMSGFGNEDDEDDEENDEVLIQLRTRKATIGERFQRYGDCPQFKPNQYDSILCVDCNDTKECHIVSQTYARDLCPTNAYGLMEFVGANRMTRAMYIRLVDKTPKPKLVKLFREEWNLKRWPNLLISVVGGGGASFSLSKNLDTNLRHGLRKVALSTNAWFLTGGTDNGAIKFVGSVLQGHTYKDVKIIGIVPWGVVAGREILESNGNTLKDYAPRYPPQRVRKHTGIRKREFYLNRNHSHFVLVDTGKFGIVDGELEFRSQLESMIINEQIKQFRKSMTLPARKKNDDDCNKKFIPAVQIVINGGSRIIETVANTLQVEMNDDVTMPVLVVAGSGRAADLLALAYKLTNDDNNFNQLGGSYEYVLMNKIEALYPGQSHEENIRTLSFLMKCMKKKKHITIYDAQQDNADLDEAILTALMRMNEEDEVYNGSPSSSLDLYTIAQLNLTLLWNRADIADKEIFKRYPLKRHEPLLEDLMMSALLQNKRSFVELLLENGFDLKTFNYEKLAKLYCENYIQQKSILTAFIKIKKQMKTEISLTNGEIIINDSTVDRRYSYDTAVISHLNLQCIQEAFIKLSGIDLTPFYGKSGITAQEKLHHPLNELFLWAILCNRHDLALCFWNRGNEFLAKALIAHKLYLKMADYYRANHASIEEEVLCGLKRNANEFGQLALDLLDHCSSVDKQATKQLLSQELNNWGDQTCMGLAESSEFEEFISHPSCQDLVLEKWRGSLVFYGRRASHKVIIGLFFLPIIFMYEFKRQRSSSKIKNRERGILKDVAFNMRVGAEKIKLFFDAPITKFWLSVFAFLAFLYLFGSILLTPSFPAFPSVMEWCVVGFIVNFTIEEIRQVITSCGILFHQKLHAWWSQAWNKVDLCAIIFFYIGFAMRMTDNESVAEGGRVIYALDLMVWILRLLEVFSVNRKLGPYVVMIRRMLFDVIYFIIILTVFLLSYGIARYAILKPTSEMNMNSLIQIMAIPYFQIFGEVFLEDLDEEGHTKTVFKTTKHNAYSEGVVLSIMAVYLLLTNILLVNLLIAVFNNTYSRVQLNSKRVWKWQWYCLVEEYSTHPTLVPPFTLIFYFIDALRFFKRCFCSKRLQEFDLQQKRYSILHTDAAFQLMKFEEECQSNYLVLKEASLHDNEKKYEEIKARGNRLEDMLVATTLRLAILDKKVTKLTKSSQSSVIRLTRVEKLVQKSITDSNKAPATPAQLRNTPSTLSDSNAVSAPKLTKLFATKSFLDLNSSLNSLTLKLKKEESFGEQKSILARSLCYPYSNVQRFTFDEKYVDWKVDFEGYNPPHHTSLAVQVNLSWADSEDVDKIRKLNFNAIDGNIDRRSFLGEYDVISGVPRNPMGRTGLTGRGCLGRYGPNHIVEPIVTRYQKRRDGSVYSDSFEVLAVLKDSGDYELPSGPTMVDKKIPFILGRLLNENTLREIGLTEDKHRLPAMKNVENIFNEKGKMIYQGYLDDERNTDNAWVESSVVHYHDDGGALNKFFICERLVKFLRLHWIDLNENASLPEHQITYLRTVAIERNISFDL